MVDAANPRNKGRPMKLYLCLSLRHKKRLQMKLLEVEFWKARNNSSYDFEENNFKNILSMGVDKFI